MPDAGRSLRCPPRPQLSVTLDDLGGWPGVLGMLASGADLDAAHAGAALTEVLEGNATPAQIAAFIFGLRCKGETVEEMTGLVAAMLRRIRAGGGARRDGGPGGGHVRDRRGPPWDHQRVDHRRPGRGRGRRPGLQARRAGGLVQSRFGGRAGGARRGDRSGPGRSGPMHRGGGDRLLFRPAIPPGDEPRHTRCGANWVYRPPSTSSVPLANPARVRRQVVGVGDPAMARQDGPGAGCRRGHTRPGRPRGRRAR